MTTREPIYPTRLRAGRPLEEWEFMESKRGAPLYEAIAVPISERWAGKALSNEELKQTISNIAREGFGTSEPGLLESFNAAVKQASFGYPLALHELVKNGFLNDEKISDAVWQNFIRLHQIRPARFSDSVNVGIIEELLRAPWTSMRPKQVTLLRKILQNGRPMTGRLQLPDPEDIDEVMERQLTTWDESNELLRYVIENQKVSESPIKKLISRLFA